MPVNHPALIQKERLAAFSQNDLNCLEHLRNVGKLVGEPMQVQDCNTVRRDLAQQLRKGAERGSVTSAVQETGLSWLRRCLV
ncbi:hypothetical protein ABFP30_001625 [Enterobacter bugandensis]